MILFKKIIWMLLFYLYIYITATSIVYLVLGMESFGCSDLLITLQLVATTVIMAICGVSMFEKLRSLENN